MTFKNGLFLLPLNFNIYDVLIVEKGRVYKHAKERLY